MMQTETDAGPSAPSKKSKFTPKIPPRKHSKPRTPKSEPVDAKENVLDKELMSKLQRVQQSQDGFGRRVPRTHKQSALPEVAFGYVDESSLARTYGKTSAGANDGNVQDGFSESESASRSKKEYVEPYDYNHSYYPVILPLRMPYSGDPEVLNELEFGKATTSLAVDDAITAAEKLNLMEKTDEPQMLFFQFPASLPFQTQSNDNPKGKDIAESKVHVRDGTSSSNESSGMKNGFDLEDMPSGFMGKLLVYKNGAIKMRLGDALFDVSPGSDCMFAQEVAAINTKQRHCCIVGEIRKRAIVTPDVDALLESSEDKN